MRWNIAACAATANKCLHGVPGLAFVIVQRQALPPAGQRRGAFIYLRQYCEAQDAGSTPYTQTVQASMPSMRRYRSWMKKEDGGAPAALPRHLTRIREELAAVGFLPLLPPSLCSVVLILSICLKGWIPHAPRPA